jgi:hypothetical protein
MNNAGSYSSLTATCPVRTGKHPLYPAKFFPVYVNGML